MIATRQSGAAAKNDRVTEHERRTAKQRNRPWLEIGRAHV